MDTQVERYNLVEKTELNVSIYGKVVGVFDVSKKRYIYLFFKRILGVVLSCIAIVLLSPILLCVSIAIKIEDGGKIFFSQKRIGKDNRSFTMYKFRSMCKDAEKHLSELEKLNERDGPIFKIRNDPRVTRVGKFIRKTCIDELPQLINIIKGDMCIVGPRPPLLSEVNQYTPYEMQRLNITPGLTCYWQVQKNKNMTFEEIIEMDLNYIEKMNLWVDFKMILMTMRVMLLGMGEG